MNVESPPIRSRRGRIRARLAGHQMHAGYWAAAILAALGFSLMHYYGRKDNEDLWLFGALLMLGACFLGLAVAMFSDG